MELAKRDHYRERLLAERAQLVNEMNRISESIPEEVRPSGEHEIAQVIVLMSAQSTPGKPLPFGEFGVGNKIYRLRVEG